MGSESGCSAGSSFWSAISFLPASQLPYIKCCPLLFFTPTHHSLLQVQHLTYTCPLHFTCGLALWLAWCSSHPCSLLTHTVHWTKKPFKAFAQTLTSAMWIACTSPVPPYKPWLLWLNLELVPSPKKKGALLHTAHLSFWKLFLIYPKPN